MVIGSHDEPWRTFNWIEEDRGIRMAQLHIDLQSGFTGDTVIVEIDNQQVFHEQNVHTSLLTGLAVGFTVQVPTGIVTLTVHVPSRNLSKTTQIDTGQVNALGIYIESGALHFIKSGSQLGYA
jgi:hypothetical protein